MRVLLAFLVLLKACLYYHQPPLAATHCSSIHLGCIHISILGIRSLLRTDHSSLDQVAVSDRCISGLADTEAVEAALIVGSEA